MTVRVPQGYECVSSCTICVYGGFSVMSMRSARPYQVHSASAVSGHLGDKFKAALLKDPDLHLRSGQLKNRSMLAIWRFVFWLTSKILYCYCNRRPSSFRRTIEAFSTGQNRIHPIWRIRMPTNPERLNDVNKFKSEGISSAQNIAMRIERECMAQAIQDLEAILPSLGPRAKPALDMVRTMYMTSIMETSTLSRTELIKMGYHLWSSRLRTRELCD